MSRQLVKIAALDGHKTGKTLQKNAWEVVSFKHTLQSRSKSQTHESSHKNKVPDYPD